MLRILQLRGKSQSRTTNQSHSSAESYSWSILKHKLNFTFVMVFLQFLPLRSLHVSAPQKSLPISGDYPGGTTGIPEDGYWPLDTGKLFVSYLNLQRLGVAALELYNLSVEQNPPPTFLRIFTYFVLPFCSPSPSGRAQNSRNLNAQMHSNFFYR